MASPTSWEFYIEIETKTLWVNICTQNLEGVAISINKWWKTRYPAYKIRIVSKKEFELIKKFNKLWKVVHKLKLLFF